MAKRKRLIWHLYPTYLLITLICLGAVAWYASNRTKLFFLDQVAEDLEVRARIFEKQALRHLSLLNERAIDSMCKEVGRASSTRITVMLPSGRVVGDSDEDPSVMSSWKTVPG